MTAPARLPAAPDLLPRELAIQYWHRAAEIRREWLDHGLSTEPADRAAAEHSLTGIYARISRSRPRFVWLDSPRRVRDLVVGLPTHEVLQDWVRARRPPGRPPLASDLAAGLSRLRSALDECISGIAVNANPAIRKGRKPSPELPPLEALKAGVHFREVLRQGVSTELRNSLAEGFYLPIRAALGALPVCWYGQQESYWVAYYDAWRRLGLDRYQRADDEHFDDWAAVARSCGWWWPGEDRCVVVERPAFIRTEGVRLAEVKYRDGWTVRPG